MNRALRVGYEAAAQLLRASAAAAGALPPSSGKVMRALRARAGIRRRFSEWSAEHRDPGRPLLWMHAPSVGEGLQARPVLELVRQRRPEVQLAYTFFSPSASSFASTLDVDFADYLPFDSTTDASLAIESLRPTAIVFAKLDVWPTLCAVAHARGVKLGMVSATLTEGSSRSRPIAGALLRDAYALLDAVGAIARDDAERLTSLGVRAERITVTGDTRYDQVWARAHTRAPSLVDGPHSERPTLADALRSERPTLVAGSTWPADDVHLLPALAALRTAHPGLRAIIAPHEPTPAHLAPLERWASDERWRVDRLAVADTDSDLVLVDRLGILGDLYGLADIAFVGGGFHDAGLHSVLEPAAFGTPVLFGPRFTKSRDARVLVERGGAASVTDALALETAAERWLDDAGERHAAGARAEAVVRDGLGAAERSFALVTSLLA